MQRDSDDEDQDTTLRPAEKSATALEIEELHATILKFARTRERLPQPLFWSLFNSRIKDIKRNKELSRLLKDVLG